MRRAEPERAASVMGVDGAGRRTFARLARLLFDD